MKLRTLILVWTSRCTPNSHESHSSNDFPRLAICSQTQVCGFVTQFRSVLHTQNMSKHISIHIINCVQQAFCEALHTEKSRGGPKKKSLNSKTKWWSCFKTTLGQCFSQLFRINSTRPPTWFNINSIKPWMVANKSPTTQKHIGKLPGQLFKTILRTWEPQYVSLWRCAFGYHARKIFTK